MEERPKCNRWLLLSFYFIISFGICGLVGSFTAILPLLRRACVFSNFCRCDPTTKAYRGDDCLNPDLRDLILFEPLSHNDNCDPLGCNAQNGLHIDAWKMGLSVPLITSPIAGTIADIIGPRALGTIGALFICFGLFIWLLLTSAFKILWAGKYLLSLSWLSLGIGRVCISYSIVSVSSLFAMQSLVISILGGLIDASIILPLLLESFQTEKNESNYLNEHDIYINSNGEKRFIYIYMALSVFSLVVLFFTLPSVTFNKLKKPRKKLGPIKKYISCKDEAMEGGLLRQDLETVDKTISEEDCYLSCPNRKQIRTRSEVTNIKVKVTCTYSDRPEYESSAICDLKTSSAIMGGYSVVCSLAKCKFLLNLDKLRSHSSPFNASNCTNAGIRGGPNTVNEKSLREQLFSYEYFTFMMLFIFNFWRCSILVSKSEFIVSTLLLKSSQDVSLEEKLPPIMNIYNVVMGMGSVFSIILGIITTKYGVNFMIGLITILGCFIHILLIFISNLPFWSIYLYFGSFSFLRSFIFGSLNCFIGDTFGFSNFARLAGIQAFICFIFFQIMNFLTSNYFETISWTKVNQYLLIPNLFLLIVPLILRFLKRRRMLNADN